MEAHEFCNGHSGMEERMKNAEKSIQTIWKAIDGMKTWVILGMGAVIMQLAIFIGNLFTAVHPAVK